MSESAMELPPLGSFQQERPRLGGPGVIDRNTAKFVRAYVRGVLAESLIARQYEIAMGVATFSVATKAGNVVSLPAPAVVQNSAIDSLMRIAVPSSLVQDDGAPIMPGVLILGDFEIDAAREIATEQRQLEANINRPMGSGIYTPPPGFDVVITEDDLSGGDAKVLSPDDAPPPIVTAPTNKAQEFAAARRARGTNG